MTDQTETPAPTGTAIETRPARQLNLAGIGSTGPRGVLTFLPQTMEDCLTIAQLMAKSDFAVPPKFRGNPGACLAVAIQAARWGADPFAVIQKAYVTKSKSGDERLAYEAQLVAAVVNTQAPIVGRPRLIYSGQATARRVKCICVFRDTGEEREIETPPISQINPKNSPLWVSDPDQQLAYYALRAWGRRWTPEILLGIYTPEELQVVEATDAPRPERPNVQLSAGPSADETGITRAPEPEPVVEVAEEPEPVVAEEPETVGEGLEVTSSEAAAADAMVPAADDEIVDDGQLVAGDDGEVDREHAAALAGWEAYLQRAKDQLFSTDLRTEADFDAFGTKTKAELASADGINEDERDDLRARFVSAFLNRKRDLFNKGGRR